MQKTASNYSVCFMRYDQTKFGKKVLRVATGGRGGGGGSEK